VTAITLTCITRALLYIGLHHKPVTVAASECKVTEVWRMLYDRVIGPECTLRSRHDRHAVHVTLYI